VAAAEGRLSDLASGDWGPWTSSGAGYETHAKQLELLKKEVLAALASIWKGRSDATYRWYESTCRPAVETALTKFVRQQIAKARSEELRRCGADSPQSPVELRPDAQWPSVPPNDPRYGEWQMIRGILQRDEGQAKGALFGDFKITGVKSAILTFAKEGFESCARILLTSVSNVATAEDVAEGLDEAFELTLSAPLLQDAERRIGLPPSTLAKELRFDLSVRLEYWKKAAFERGLEGGISAQTDGSKQARNTPATAEPNFGLNLPVEAEPSGGQPAEIGRVVEPANSETPYANRRLAVDAYIEEVFNRTGKRITRTDIWKSARYKSRTEFERWERNDPKNPNRTAHQRFTRILTEKPHLK